MIDLKFDLIEPFLPTLKPSQQERVEAWLPALQVVLNSRYGDRITQGDDGNEPLFFNIVGDAIERRLSRPGMVLQQNIGPAGVRYDPRGNLSRWFLAEELEQLDEITGFGGIRSKRTPAPDGQRFGNRVSHWTDTVDESDEGDIPIGSI